MHCRRAQQSRVKAVDSIKYCWYWSIAAFGIEGLVGRKKWLKDAADILLEIVVWIVVESLWPHLEGQFPTTCRWW